MAPSMVSSWEKRATNPRPRRKAPWQCLWDGPGLTEEPPTPWWPWEWNTDFREEAETSGIVSAPHLVLAVCLRVVTSPPRLRGQPPGGVQAPQRAPVDSPGQVSAQQSRAHRPPDQQAGEGSPVLGPSCRPLLCWEGAFLQPRICGGDLLPYLCPANKEKHTW